jgi:pantoate--beta-alanine ligase
MLLITSPSEMSIWSDARRAAGERIGLVPTMGYLHAGHLSLVAAAQARADRVAVSIFVNPLQFGPQEDLERYPRDLERDRELLQNAGTNVLFVPDAGAMYPEGFQTQVEVERTSLGLCGASRPGHFRGVTTVVTKLFHIARPHVAVFGEKDYQQLAVIRRMTRDLDFGIDIVGVPTVRERDGLAMSSRNAYLGPAERRAAVCVPAALEAARRLFATGERDALRILAAARQVIGEEALARIDYVNLVDADTLEQVTRVDAPALLAVAVRMGKTRLIDNCVLAQGGHRHAPTHAVG